MTKGKRRRETEFREGIERSVSHTLAAARLVREFRRTLPSDVGCLVLTFEYSPNGHMGYCSTGDRDDCIRLVREFLSNFEGN